MKKLVVGLSAAAVIAALALGLSRTQAASQQVDPEECFYLQSLHYTAAGMGYWYSKEQGGLETITGIPYEELGCRNCHAEGCDRCHQVVEKKGDCQTYHYSTKAAAQQGRCLTCHGRERAMIAINHKVDQEDVHLKQGMVCVDCHSAREMHGDGNTYVSLKAPGAMDTQCANCHDSVKPTESHTVHQGKLDCKACHLRHVVSCTNCHFDTLVKKGKRKAIPVSGWLFLMNYQGKVSSASMQTFVAAGDKTFLMFAPHMSHAVTSKGRPCQGCHGTETMRQAQKGSLTLTWLKDGRVHNLKGVIPVVDRVEYQCSYQDLQDGKWVPLKDHAAPVRQYAAFGEPLTSEQLRKLVQPQEAPPPLMNQPPAHAAK
jgi:hypothetical protein